MTLDVQYVTEADLEILQFALEARAEEVDLSGLYIEEEDVD